MRVFFSKDTRDHVLACFGGAGGQHACAIARSLGMNTVYVHKYAGILSAYGMALADVIHEEQAPCVLKYSQVNFLRLVAGNSNGNFWVLFCFRPNLLDMVSQLNGGSLIFLKGQFETASILALILLVKLNRPRGKLKVVQFKPKKCFSVGFRRQFLPLVWNFITVKFWFSVSVHHCNH